jgi:hypothetical protein
MKVIALLALLAASPATDSAVKLQLTDTSTGSTSECIVSVFDYDYNDPDKIIYVVADCSPIFSNGFED